VINSKLRVLLAALLFVTFVIAALSGCREPTPRPATESPLKVVADARKPTGEQVALLAEKHSLDETVVRQILVTYMERHDAIYRLYAEADQKGEPLALLDSQASGPIANTLKELAARFQVPSSKVAGLIIDYQTMRRCQ